MALDHGHTAENPQSVSDSCDKFSSLSILLKSSLERQQVSFLENENLKEKLAAMNDRIKGLENQIKTDKMIISFRDSRIENLKAGGKEQSDDDEIASILIF